MVNEVEKNEWCRDLAKVGRLIKRCSVVQRLVLAMADAAAYRLFRTSDK
jgi:hypothetical protein